MNDYIVYKVLKVRCFDESIEASSKGVAIDMAIHADLWHDWDNARETYEAEVVNQKGGLKVITDLLDSAKKESS